MTIILGSCISQKKKKNIRVLLMGDMQHPLTWYKNYMKILMFYGE